MYRPELLFSGTAVYRGLICKQHFPVMDQKVVGGVKNNSPCPKQLSVIKTGDHQWSQRSE